jgi:UDP-glucuronate decarboxylase
MRPDDGRVVSNFIVQALTGQDITIYGDGSQTRSFCFVDDLISGIVRMMASPASLTGPVNLGNPGEFTIRELAEQVIGLTGSRSQIIHLPLPVDDPRQRRPDISLAMQELDWRPKMALSSGLRQTIDYFDGLLTRSARELEAV